MVKLIINSDTDHKHVEKIIKGAIDTEIKRLEIGLKRTKNEIKKYEIKYGINSETFRNEWTAEKLDGGDDEYVSWVGEIEIQKAITEDLNRFNEIVYGVYGSN